MRRRALLVALPALAIARPAYPCGHDSGGGGGSSSSSSSSSSSDSGGSSSSDSSTSTPPCIDTSEVVGRAHCQGFGVWDSGRTPIVLIDFGTTLHFFPMRGLHFTGTAEHDAGIAYAVRGEQAADQAGAATWDMRVALGLGRYLYAGAESRVGKLFIAPRTIATSNQLVLDPSGGMYVTSGAIAGVRGRFGDLELRAEVMGGVRIVSLQMTSHHLDCVDDSTVTGLSALVESRVGVVAWMSPWLSLGATVGANMRARGDVSAGLFLEGHLRAFDGGR